ncbi:MAG: GDSL-type esterase/lipase family protein [Bacteroidales bacterium]
MRKTVVAFACVLSLTSTAQRNTYSTYWHQRASLFEELPINKKDIVFVGNSITDGGEWFELLSNSKVKNRGISGDRTVGVYDRLESIVSGRPKKLFLMIGVNDLAHGTSVDTIASNIAKIIESTSIRSPKTKIYLQSVLPMTDEKKMFGSHTARANDVVRLNAKLNSLAQDRGITYIDLYSQFINDETGKLDLKYSNDGLHLLGAGYKLWAEIVKPYVNEK